jgi:poly(3-hydroxybutyrate) depolymerase
MRKQHHWFENSVIFKVPSAYPGYLRKVYPGFLQHAGFVAMNPDRHLNSHWDYYLDLVRETRRRSASSRPCQWSFSLS